MRTPLGLVVALALGHGLVVAAPDAQDVLAASDAIRNPGRSFSVTVTLTEFQAGKQVDTSTLTTYARAQEQGGQFASLIRFVLPARDAGKLMLKNGNDLWFYDPATKASVRLSPQQRLMGQASNGDVVTVNMAKDYRATLLSEEEVQDGERRKRNAYKLGLAAAAPDVTYPTIEIWIDAENNRPLKARFFAESGRLLKTAYYRRFQQQLGTERPTETVIIGRLGPAIGNLVALLGVFGSTGSRDLAHRDYLPRFQPE
jgi:outer membrane lipoprotein-sorting protein